LRLRDAILLSNSNPGSDLITFAPELQGAIWLLSALPPIIGDTSIDGGPDVMPGFHRIAIARDDSNPNIPAFRIIHVTGNLDLRNITIMGGRAIEGGGIFVEQGASAYVYNTAVSGNKAEAGVAGGRGGGIRNNGTIVVDQSTITANYARLTGGGIHNSGFLVLQYDSLIWNNSCNTDGGGLFNSLGATAEIRGSRIRENVAGDPAIAIAAGQGGGLFNAGTLQVSDSYIFENRALDVSCAGGGLFCEVGSSATLTSVSITGNRANNANADGMGGGFYLRTTGSLSFTNCILSGNRADIGPSFGGWVEAMAIYSWVGNGPEDPVGPPT
jgi:hypothetical protein